MAKNDTEATAQPDRTTVYLGNRKAVSINADGDRISYPGKRCTTVVLRPDATLMEALGEITGPNGLWAAHSDAPAPAWVAAEGPLAEAITSVLGAHYHTEIRPVEHEAEAV